MSDTAQNLGQKFTCFKCECKFYDLGSPEPLCPRCGADQRENLTAAPAPTKRKRRGAAAPAVAAPKSAPADEANLGSDDLLDDDFDDAAPPSGNDKDLKSPAEPETTPEPAAKKAAKKPAKKPAAKKAAKKPAAKKAAKK